VIADEFAAVKALPMSGLFQVLGHLRIAISSWYRSSLDEKLQKCFGPAPKEIRGFRRICGSKNDRLARLGWLACSQKTGPQ
jgi:hypothetical protein